MEIKIGIIVPTKQKIYEDIKYSENLVYDYSKYFSKDYLSDSNYLMLEFGIGYKITKDPILIKNNINLYLPVTDKEIDEEYIIQFVQSGIFLLNSNFSFFSDAEYNLVSKEKYLDESYALDFGVSFIIGNNSEIKLGQQNRYSNSEWTPGIILSYEKIFN